MRPRLQAARRRRGRRRRPGLPAVLLVAVTAAAWAVTGPPAGGVEVPGTAPLEASLVGSGGSWAVVAMGHLGDPANTFWQVFSQPTGATGWGLVTPPGVATNGGLVAASAGAGPLLAGLEPTQRLRYSPVSRSADGGRRWVPGILPTSLAAVPDALAVGSGGALALVRLAGGQVWRSPDGLTGYRPLVTRAVLAASAAACGVTVLSAVAWGPGGRPLVGTGCSKRGAVGLFSGTGGHWTPVGPPLGGAGAPTSTTVLRLATTGSTASALIATESGGRQALVAASATGAGWVVSPALVLGRARPLRSTGGDGSGGWVVLTGGSGRAGSALWWSATSRRWHRLPPPPVGTGALAVGPGGRVDALASSGSRLTVAVLAPLASSWTTSQRISVPISYGSSS